MAKNPDDPVQINLIFTEATLNKHNRGNINIKEEHVWV